MQEQQRGSNGASNAEGASNNADRAWGGGAEGDCLQTHALLRSAATKRTSIGKANRSCQCEIYWFCWSGVEWSGRLAWSGVD